MFDVRWDIDKYKTNYDLEHWDLCRAFMETHKTKYPEQKLAHLTEAFYQMGVYGSSYDPKTTRMVNALTVEVLDNLLKSHPAILHHPFNKSAVVVPEASDSNLTSKEDQETSQPSSSRDVQVDQNIIANVLKLSQLKEMFKGFVIIYDIRKVSTINDNKVTILEDSFKRSKFGPCHWAKDDTHNNICPIRMALKWRNIVLAEAVGSDEKSLKIRLAQATLSKMATFSPGIEAKWNYYKDGRLPDWLEKPNPRKSHIYRLVRRSQFKAMAEITSYIDTFANSDSFAEVIFSMDFSNQEKKQLMEYIDKTWCTKLMYRTLSKIGVKNKSESHVFVYHIRTGEELRHWLEQTGYDNDRYRMVQPGKHKRAGNCDDNVREVLNIDTVGKSKEADSPEENTKEDRPPLPTETFEESKKNSDKPEETKDKDVEIKDKETDNQNKEKDSKKVDDTSSGEDDFEKMLDGFVLFYDASKTSEIDKDDWFTALCESFKLSKFGPLDVIVENVRPLRTRCVFKLNDKTLASAEGLTETQAKTAATLQLISKLEPFTYIIQAKEEYFCKGKVPPFLEDPDKIKSCFWRLVRRKDLPSYYTIFQTIDEFGRSQSQGEIIFGPDFTWELKNEIVVYLKAKGLSHRYFTLKDQKPWTHMAIYRNVKPDELKDHLMKNGGENEKYKLIPPPKAEPLSDKTSEEPKVTSSKESGKPPTTSAAKKPVAKAVEKRKQQETEPEPLLGEIETNKIQIKLKKFKVDKVDYPEDTGGEFPGLIIWIGIRKSSVWQKSLFNIILDSFKMSKYGELLIEETEEPIWGRKEPLKKCVMKCNRRMLAVGLGESKAEAKNSASLQVMRKLRKHCYTIQAKPSYFKEGKATPYNFNPDPAKAHVYKLMKRNQLKERADMIKYIDDFAKNSSPEEVIFGDDFTYDEREYILDHCRKIDLSYRLMKCQSASKVMHSHIAVFHQLPPPVIKTELMRAGGESDKYRLVPPGGKITNQASATAIDFWPDTLEDEKEIPPAGVSTTNLPVQQNDISQSTEPQTLSLPQNNETTIKPGSAIPSLINREVICQPFLPTAEPTTATKPGPGVTEVSLKFNQKGNDIDNFTPAVVMVTSKNPKTDKSPTKLSKEQGKSNMLPKTNNQMNKYLSPHSPQNQLLSPQTQCKPVGSQPLNNQMMIPPEILHNQQIGPQPFNHQVMEPPQILHNQPMGPQPLNHQVMEPPQFLHNQLIGPQPSNHQVMGPPQLLLNQPMGPQPQFVQPSLQEVQPPPFQDVPFAPPPLFIPPPPIYSQPFMDTPLQFGPNPPNFVPQYPCDIGPVRNMSVPPPILNQPPPVIGPITESSAPFPPNKTQISVPSVTITVPNSPQKADLREELAKKRQVENRKSSPSRVVFDTTIERRVINQDENDSDGWSRTVFVAESSNEQNEQERSIPQDLREILRHKDPVRETKTPEEPVLRRNSSPKRNFNDGVRRGSPENTFRRFNSGEADRRSSNFDRQRMSPGRNRNVSQERWRSRERSPEQRIVRRRDSSHERRIFHDSSRSSGRFRSRSRSVSPRSRESPHTTIFYRDLWDNIPARYSDSIFMYKYVKQDSKTETDPYALLRATRSLYFNTDFDFIKEQTTTGDWNVSVELICDDADIQPLVGEGRARSEKEASRRAAEHAVETVQKACRVIEPKYSYFCEGGVPDFIARKYPMKTSVYEIIRNMEPKIALASGTFQIIFEMFMQSDLEDIFFLASDFSNGERTLVIELADRMNLWWRLFGPRHPAARRDDVVSTQHVCVFKQKSALQLIRELLANGGSTEKYMLVDPREYRLTRPR